MATIRIVGRMPSDGAGQTRERANENERHTERERGKKERQLHRVEMNIPQF